MLILERVLIIKVWDFPGLFLLRKNRTVSLIRSRKTESKLQNAIVFRWPTSFMLGSAARLERLIELYHKTTSCPMKMTLYLVLSGHLLPVKDKTD